ncbi:MAG: hypothetical protein AAGA46_00815 [Cyanobacteria bacterium P01_F01_bin.13]
MDMSMILGLALAGSIVLLSGNKEQDKKKSKAKRPSTEFIVRVGDGDVAVSPKQ